MEVLDVMPSAATIKTLANTRVASISNRNLREIYKADIKSFSLIIMNLARDLSRRLRRMDERAAEMVGK
jgi:CRP-like cAMP-binding protein